MSRLHSEDRKKVRNFSDISSTQAETDLRRKIKAINDEAKRNSLEYKISEARSKCIQPLYHLEKAWKQAIKGKNSEQIQETRFKLLRGMDQAATDYLGRIMAEIKQTYLGKKGLYKDNMLQVNLSIDVFYTGFKKFCNNELNGYSISETEFQEILSWEFKRNLTNLKNYETTLGYDKTLKQFNKNLEYLKEKVVVEKELSL